MAAKATTYRSPRRKPRQSRSSRKSKAVSTTNGTSELSRSALATRVVDQSLRVNVIDLFDADQDAVAELTERIRQDYTGVLSLPDAYIALEDQLRATLNDSEAKLLHDIIEHFSNGNNVQLHVRFHLGAAFGRRVRDCEVR